MKKELSKSKKRKLLVIFLETVGVPVLGFGVVFLLFLLEADREGFYDILGWLIVALCLAGIAILSVTVVISRAFVGRDPKIVQLPKSIENCEALGVAFITCSFAAFLYKMHWSFALVFVLAGGAAVSVSLRAFRRYFSE